ncbi:MAG: GAF domain-containing protein [bacterium]|nr:GAF domain-containing protein [bacterium]MCP4964869.1 GAF domain-containing protein [bacterium]
MTTDIPPIRHRIRAVYIALLLSWVAFVVVVVARNQAGKSFWTDSVPFFGLALALLTIVPWGRVLRSIVADLVILFWATLGVIAVVILGNESDGAVVAIALLGMIILPAVISLRGIYVAGIAIAATGAFSYITSQTDLPNSIGAWRTAAFAIAASLIAIGAGNLHRHVEVAAQRVHTFEERERFLSEKEQELQRLYDVSRTIGVGSNLSEVLPELVGRLANALEARVGVVLLYRRDEEALEVMSPIWVAGQTLRAEGYSLPLSEPSIAQQVFTSGEPAVFNNLEERAEEADGFLLELGSHELAAVPLRIENRPIGVLITAEKRDAHFTVNDLALLESLAGPSALVLNQLARYEEAKETSQKAIELAQLKTDFVSVVSHELRTPLTAIIGSLSTLQRPQLAHPDPSAQQLIDTASRQANRLRSLIEDLLVVSRLDNQALPVRPELIHLQDFIEDTVAHIPDAAEVTYVQTGPGVDSVETDPDHLHRILVNLVGNALKYAPGSPIDIVAMLNGNEVWLSIIDHGEGIPYELHDHIFDRFTQLAPHYTRSAGGTGLGLSIVRGLSEVIGGRVWFQPTAGGGATFTVALPKVARARYEDSEPAAIA